MIDLEPALELYPSAETMSAAIAGLRDLVERGHRGDDAAYREYQSLLFDLHHNCSLRPHATRDWLASVIHVEQERFIDRPEAIAALPAKKFEERILQVFEQGTRLKHPLSAYMFTGQPTLDNLKIFLRHHWYRSRHFWRELANFSLRLDLASASVIYGNLHEESGSALPGKAHPFLLAHLLEYLGLSPDFEQKPTLFEALPYLNNRIRCSRHDNVGWGLAVLFALEYGTPANHSKLYELLRQFSVPEEYCEFHRLHAIVDQDHGRDLLRLSVELLTTAETQNAFFTSLRHHQQLGWHYFDAIWREMGEPKP
jgi:pyrroloquinoline quinone (PQQ) biosynthesis protein C